MEGPGASVDLQVVSGAGRRRREPAGRRDGAALAAGALAGLAAGYGALPGLPAVGPVRAAAVGLAGALAVLACLRRAWGEDGARRRLGWRVVAVAVAMAVLASLVHRPEWLALAAAVALVAAVAAGLVVLCGVPTDRGARWRAALDTALVAGCLTWLAFGLPVGRPVALIGLAGAALVGLTRCGYPGGPPIRTLWPLVAAALLDVVVRSAGSGLAPGGRALLATAALGLVAAAAGADGTRGDDPRRVPWREAAAVAALVTPLTAILVRLDLLTMAGERMPYRLGLGLLGVCGLAVVRLVVARADELRGVRTLESRVAQQTLARAGQETWFRELVQHSSDIITVVDPVGLVRYQSPSVGGLLGYDPNHWVGLPLAGLLPPGEVRRVEAVLAEAARRPGSTRTVDCPLRHASGRWCEAETIVTSMVDHPDIRGLVLNTRDVSERKQLEEQLTRAAFHDPLTGLANRALFRDRVEQALAERGGDAVAVLFCDLDGFKAVNDTQGHAVGDQLLGLVAERLLRCVRPVDTVARLGGDEFAVLVPGAEAGPAAVGVAERIAAVLARPFVVDGRELYVGASMGIASTATGADRADVLLRNADLAMYRAKAAPDVPHVVFAPQMHDVLAARVAVEHDLRQALAQGQLDVHYQPTVDLRTGRMVGVEALLRWWHPTRGPISPEEFIPVAEESGLITPIGEWVLDRCLRQAVSWQQLCDDGPFPVAVNISMRQLQPSLLETLTGLLARTGLPAASLTLEMTESVLLERTDDVIRLLRELKALGVRLAIDDFGTGYSSLSYLTRFPVDVLKIDRGFVERLGGGAPDGGSAELTRSIVSLGRSLGLVTVAEGVQTGEQLAALREMGCDLGQGYLFARPVAAMGITELLALRGGADPAGRRQPAVA